MSSSSSSSIRQLYDKKKDKKQQTNNIMKKKKSIKNKMLVSEFLVNDIENYHDYQKLLRKRKNKDNNYNCLLSNIALIYYNNPLIFNKFNEEEEATTSNNINQDPIDLYINNNDRRQQHPIYDVWTLYEISLFQQGICIYGKNFMDISALIKSKSVNECIEMYYHWKKSSNYYMWKEFGKIKNSQKNLRINKELLNIIKNF